MIPFMIKFKFNNLFFKTKYLRVARHMGLFLFKPHLQPAAIQRTNQRLQKRFTIIPCQFLDKEQDDSVFIHHISF
jgi:hypothetical protein